MHSLAGMQQQVQRAASAAAAGGGSSPSSHKHNTAAPSTTHGRILPPSSTRPPRCSLSISHSSPSSLTEFIPFSRDGSSCGSIDALFANMSVEETCYNGLFTQHGLSGVQTATDSWDTNAFLDRFALIELTVLLLQSCRKTKDLERARVCHLHICSNGLDTHKAVENYIVPMFVECGSISAAQFAFNKLACCKEHSWTSLISGYCECGQMKFAFDIYRQMQEDGEDPSVHTFLVFLKASTTHLDIEFGREIHMEVVKEGVEKDSLVGSSLISLYAKCGSLTEAQDAFEDLSIKASLSWTSLISGYAEHGPHDRALVLLVEMRVHGVNPDVSTYTCGLKACGHIGGIDEGFQLHTDMAIIGIEGDLYVGSTLVCMYAKCGLLSEAEEVFVKLPLHDVISWNALLAGYVDSGADQEALICYERMKKEGKCPDTITYASTLKACGSIGALFTGQEIHAELVKVASEGDFTVCNGLVSMYAKSGALLEAQQVFQQLPVQSVVGWTSLIAGYVDHGSTEEAFNCLEKVWADGILPDVAMLACCLKACPFSGTLEKGQEIHMDLVKRGLEKDLSMSNPMVSMYAKAGLVIEAHSVCNSLPVRDVVVWTALIAGYAEYGHTEEVSSCLTQMQAECITPNAITFTCALRASGISRSATNGQEVHEKIVFRALESEVLIGNALISMYTRCGLLVEAREVFGNLQAKDAVSWNTIIAGLAEHGSGQEALNIFEQMQDEGHSPDAVTLISIFKVCGNIGALERGRELHMKIKSSGFHKDVSVGNSLISMYAKCGSSMEAQEVFDMLPVRNVVTWSTMIKAYGMNHEGEKAIRCFEDMQEQGVKPDAVTFSCLLLACSHAGMVCEGREYLKMMRENYGILPTAEHYACVIDLLARSGQLYAAENFIVMACPTAEETWASLLSGCKTYSDPELGLRCLHELAHLDCGVAAWYVLMADIYATAGNWDAVRRIEELRKHLGAIKKPASATIEIDDTVHEFMVGTKGSEVVSQMLSSLCSRIKEEGHLPNIEMMLNASSDTEKEAALCEHAEKLALAFGMLNTAPGATLRLTKNLRMCNDCHNMSKMISKVERREIILRDDCCMHHFKDGLCSCGDSF